MKTSKITKVLCAGMTAALMATSFTACSKTEETTTEPEETEAVETTEGEETTTAADATEATGENIAVETDAASVFTLPDKFVFDGNFELQVVGYEFFETEDKYDYDVLNVYYDFTSLSERFIKVNSISWAATQNGEEQKFDPSTNSKIGNMDFNDNIWLYLFQYFFYFAYT